MNGAAQRPFSLQGKTILVTGASSGIGRQTAIVCAQQGGRVIITGRDAERLQTTFDQLPGDGHVQVIADLANASDRERLVQSGGAIDGLVHCAGQQKHCPVRQLSEQAMTEMYSVNFLAPVMLTQRLLHANAISTQGSIIFLLSTAAHIGTRGVGPYSAMKAGLAGIIRCLALEQSKRKIRVNGISPSAVATPMWGEDQLEAQKARHPLGLGSALDVAHAAVYLLSDASRWVTGTSLVMDGGVIL
jgi:NAD(P)-dependent dehydrogenase (short-subunit alcohol dehydrogenase family)